MHKTLLYFYTHPLNLFSCASIVYKTMFESSRNKKTFFFHFLFPPCLLRYILLHTPCNNKIKYKQIPSVLHKISLHTHDFIHFPSYSFIHLYIHFQYLSNSNWLGKSFCVCSRWINKFWNHSYKHFALPCALLVFSVLFLLR